jgi:hypothetical protein
MTSTTDPAETPGGGFRFTDAHLLADCPAYTAYLVRFRRSTDTLLLLDLDLREVSATITAQLLADWQTLRSALPLPLFAHMRPDATPFVTELGFLPLGEPSEHGQMYVSFPLVEAPADV